MTVRGEKTLSMIVVRVQRSSLCEITELNEAMSVKI